MCSIILLIYIDSRPASFLQGRIRGTQFLDLLHVYLQQTKGGLRGRFGISTRPVKAAFTGRLFHAMDCGMKMEEWGSKNKMKKVCFSFEGAALEEAEWCELTAGRALHAPLLCSAPKKAAVQLHGPERHSIRTTVPAAFISDAFKSERTKTRHKKKDLVGKCWLLFTRKKRGTVAKEKKNCSVDKHEKL